MKRKALLICGLLVLSLSCRSQAVKLNVHFEHLSGLAPGDRVLYESNFAGNVDTIHYNHDGSYDVRLSIDEGFARAATEYTQFEVVDDAARAGHKAIAMILSRQDGKPLPNGAMVIGKSSDSNWSEQFNHGLAAGFAFLKQQFDHLSEDLKQVPESEAFKKLQRSLAELGEEIERSQAHARQKMKEEWLPLLERELEDLKRQLRDEGREEETAPLQEELDRIWRI